MEKKDSIPSHIASAMHKFPKMPKSPCDDPCQLRLQLELMKIRHQCESAVMKCWINYCACKRKMKHTQCCYESSSSYRCCANDMNQEAISQTNPKDAETKNVTQESSRAWESSRY